MTPSNQKIFKKSSKSFYFATLFFPKEISESVAILYAFLRVADNYVDLNPANSIGFYEFKEKYQKALEGKLSGNRVIDSFVKLQRTKDFDQEWIDSFFMAMESDLHLQLCQTINETEKYMYGSAEVVGLMMCKILNIPRQAYPYARKLGQAYQYINFIRDLKEDIALGRQYLPKDRLLKAGLKDLSEQTARKHPDMFSKFIRGEIQYFYDLELAAHEGLKFIPFRLRLPIIVATSSYKYTARTIYKRPLIVFEKKVIPSKQRLILETIKTLSSNITFVKNFSQRVQKAMYS